MCVTVCAVAGCGIEPDQTVEDVATVAVDPTTAGAGELSARLAEVVGAVASATTHGVDDQPAHNGGDDAADHRGADGRPDGRADRRPDGRANCCADRDADAGANRRFNRRPDRGVHGRSDLDVARLRV